MAWLVCAAGHAGHSTSASPRRMATSRCQRLWWMNGLEGAWQAPIKAHTSPNTPPAAAAVQASTTQRIRSPWCEIHHPAGPGNDVSTKQAPLPLNGHAHTSWKGWGGFTSDATWLTAGGGRRMPRMYFSVRGMAATSLFVCMVGGGGEAGRAQARGRSPKHGGINVRSPGGWQRSCCTSTSRSQCEYALPTQ